MALSDSLKEAKRLEENEKISECLEEEEEFNPAKVVLIDGKLLSVTYPEGSKSGWYKTSSDFRQINYTKEEIDKAFTLYIDSIFRNFDGCYAWLRILYEDEFLIAHYNPDVVYQATECYEDAERIEDALRYYISEDADKSLNSLKDFLEKEYHKYGKCNMAILESPYCDDVVICQASEVEKYKKFMVTWSKVHIEWKLQYESFGDMIAPDFLFENDISSDLPEEYFEIKKKVEKQDKKVRKSIVVKLL